MRSLVRALLLSRRAVIESVQDSIEVIVTKAVGVVRFGCGQDVGNRWWRRSPVVDVQQSREERTTLETFVHRGKANARTLTRARILLKSAEGWSTAALAAAFDVCEATVTNVRGRFAQGGLEAVLYDKVQQHRRSALSGLQTAHLIAVACSPSPDGHDHWTVRLLAQKAVELGFLTNISPTTIHDLLKKTNSSPGSMNTGACPRSEASL